MSASHFDSTLRPKKKLHAFGVVFGLLLSAVAMTTAITEGVRLLYVFSGLFLLMTVFEVIQLLPSSSYLHLSTEGVTVCTLFKKIFIPWSGIDRIFVVNIGRDAVGMDFSESYPNPFHNKMLNKLINCDFALTDQYGLDPEVLVERMNAFLQNHRQKQA